MASRRSEIRGQGGVSMRAIARAYLLGLVLVQLVQLLAQVGHRVVVLLSQQGQRLFVLHIGLLEVTSQFGQFGFTTLVELLVSQKMNKNQ